jgi:hypothetical protein
MTDVSRKRSDAPFRICNAEVLEILERQKTTNKATKRFQHRNWIGDRVSEYLKAFTSSHLDYNRREEFKAMLKSKKRKLATNEPSDDADQTGFGLSDNEVLQILDFMPTEPVDMHLMLSNFSDMPERKQEALIDLIASYKVDATLADSASQRETVTEATVLQVVKAEVL